MQNDDEPRPLEQSFVLDVYDRMAAHVIEARALLLSLPPEAKGNLNALFDVMLVDIGRQIAARLPALARPGDTPAAEGARGDDG